jgi:protein TonB
MIRVLEFSVFGAIALAAHAAVFIARPPTGAEAGGSGGDALVSIQAAPDEVAAIVAQWDRPVTVQSAVQSPTAPNVLDRPDAPVPSASRPRPPGSPQLAALPVPPTDLIQLDTASAVPTRPKPEPQPKPSPSSAGQAGQKAAGSGGSKQAGSRESAQVATASKGQQAELRQIWGAKIRNRIARSQRFPRTLRATGTSVVRLSVRRDGALLGVTLARSSGNSALDQAAIASVKRAKRFAKAPKDLPGNSFNFVLPIEKTR